MTFEPLNKPDIVEVIGQYLKIKKIGSVYAAQCPFHATNTFDSFRINKRKQFYNCFNCGEGGDVIRFVEKIENVGFKDALEILRIGNFSPAAVQKIEKKINPLVSKENNPILHSAIHYWQKHFENGIEGLAYMNGRGITSESLFVDKRIGFAPKKGLHQYLLSCGYSEDAILESGLCRKGKFGTYDFFRDRVMFPVFNNSGQLATITSRSIHPDEKIRHLHLPVEIVTLYNEQTINGDPIIITEGIIDCLTLEQEGFAAVAVFGTSGVKPQMVEAFKNKGARKVFLGFDNDANNAGEKGVARTQDIFTNAGMSTYAIAMPALHTEKKLDINDLFCKYGFTHEDFADLMDTALLINKNHIRPVQLATPRLIPLWELAKLMHRGTTDIERISLMENWPFEMLEQRERMIKHFLIDELPQKIRKMIDVSQKGRR